VRIERARPADVEDLLPLIHEQFLEHRIEVPEPGLRGAVLAVLDHGQHGILLVARDVTELVGFAYVSFTWSLEHGGRSGWLEELYVRPAHRCRGVGRALLRGVVERLREAGCAAVDLEVDRAHSRAENLYRREGFVALDRARWVRPLTRGAPDD
jgi:GNAT superfamily N-acetyltransferase